MSHHATPRVSADEGVVNVKTEIVNRSASSKTATVRTDILDPEGKLVATMRSSRSISPGATEIFDQTSEPVAQLRAGETTGFSVAVWEGGNGERAGIKAFAPDWISLALAAAPAVRG